MTIRNLDSLFKPRSIAVIGASQNLGTVGSVVVKNLHTGGFSGTIYLVNPKYASFEGQPVYADVAALPGVPDLAVIATPPASVPGLISQLGRRGTKGAVVITAGFTSDSGSALKQAMLDAAQPHLLRIVGPNCLGLLVPPLGLNASFAHLQPHRGGLAFIAQSGAILTSVIDWARPRGIGFSRMVSLGDMADVDFGDMLDYLSTDPETSAILLYIEMVTHARIGGAYRREDETSRCDQGRTPCRVGARCRLTYGSDGWVGSGLRRRLPARRLAPCAGP